MDNKTTKLMFSSNSNEWGTPLSFYNKLDSIFHFTLDPAATKALAKCSNFFTKEDDGLSKDWSGNIVFCNPPYGRGIKHWIKKGFEEGKKEDTVVVMLVPARTETKYFMDYCWHAKEIMFVKGRLTFENEDGKTNAAPFPSMVVVFDGEHVKPNFKVIER